MNYSSLRNIDISNGQGIGISLWTSGCPYKCPYCHNPETWNYNNGKEYTSETHQKILELIKSDYITRFSILGGEPLLPQNVSYIAYIIEKIKEIRPDIKIWLWTGTTFENLYNIAVLRSDGNLNDKIFNSLNWLYGDLNELEYILNNIDYLIDGRFIQEQKDLTLKWCGSKNQRVLDCAASMKQGKPIIADDVL